MPRPRTHTRYALAVPNSPRTPHRHLRVDDELWTRFSEAAEAAGQDRSTVIRDFMRWYARLPARAPMPKRPDRKAEDTK